MHTLSCDAHARMRLTVEVRTVADIQRVLFHLMEVKGRAGSDGCSRRRSTWIQYFPGRQAADLCRATIYTALHKNTLNRRAGSIIKPTSGRCMQCVRFGVVSSILLL